MGRILKILLFLLLLPQLSWAATERIVLRSNGNDLVGLLTRPEINSEQKVPLVILMHGLAATKEYPIILDTAKALEQNGIATLRFDFNGHGESGGRDVDMTILNEMDDARLFMHYALQQDWVSSVTLLGHSQGGLIAGYLAAEFGSEHIPSLVLLSPAAVLLEMPKSGMLAGQSFFDPKHLPDVFPLNSYFNMGKAYITTMTDLPPVYKTAKSYQGNVLLFEGTADFVVPPSYVKPYAQAYPHCDFKLLEGDNHSFSVHHQQVVDDIVAFVLQQNKN